MNSTMKHWMKVGLAAGLCLFLYGCGKSEAPEAYVIGENSAIPLDSCLTEEEGGAFVSVSPTQEEVEKAKKAREKAEKQAAKEKEKAEKKAQKEKEKAEKEKEKEEKIAKAAEYRKNAKRGSMADMINMVDRYNNGQVEPPVPVEEEPTDKKGKKKKK